MGIALGYAFTLAIAGGLIAICFAWLGELIDEQQSGADQRSEGFGRDADTPFEADAAPWPRIYGPLA